MTSGRIPEVYCPDDWKFYLDKASIPLFENLHEVDYTRSAMLHEGKTYGWEAIKEISQNVLQVDPSVDVLTSMEGYFHKLQAENQKAIKRLELSLSAYQANSTEPNKINRETSAKATLLEKVIQVIQRVVLAIIQAISYFFGSVAHNKFHVVTKGYLIPKLENNLKQSRELDEGITQTYSQIRVLLDIQEVDLIEKLGNLGQLNPKQIDEVAKLLKEDPYFSSRPNPQRLATKLCLKELEGHSLNILYDKLFDGKLYFQTSQVLKRRMRQQFEEKHPLKLPNRNQRISAKFNWEMPLPSQFSIPPVNHHVPLTKMLRLLEEITPLLPNEIPDDRDDDGTLTRTLPKEDFLARIRSAVVQLEKMGTISDSFFPTEVLPKKITEQIVTLYRHFIIWEQSERTALTSKDERKHKVALDHHLQQLTSIFIENIGLPLFHCSDRMVLALEQLYFERISNAVFQNGSVYDQIRAFVVKKRMNDFEVILREYLRDIDDFTTNLRYYRGKYGHFLGIKRWGLQEDIPHDYNGSVNFDIELALSSRLSQYKYSAAPRKLIEEITYIINNEKIKDPLFNFMTLRDLFESQYLGPCSEILVDEDSLWKEEATAQLLFDADVLEPFPEVD